MNNFKQFEFISAELLLPGLQYMQAERKAAKQRERQSWVCGKIEALREFKEESMNNMRFSVGRLSLELVKAYRSLENLKSLKNHEGIENIEDITNIRNLEKMIVSLKQGIGISQCSAWKETSWADKTLSSLEQELRFFRSE